MSSKISEVQLKPISKGSNDLLWRISVETYHRLIDSGAFHPEAEVELIHGVLVKKMPKNRLHAKITQRLLILLIQLIGLDKGWFLSIQDPITLQESEPEPDIAIVRGSVSDYDRHPGPQDLGVVIEVADSSIDYDSVVKKELYGMSQIPIYWLINISEQRIEIYQDPFQSVDTPEYRHQTTYVLGDQIPVVLDGIEVGKIDVNLIFE